jgi:hypothetical protein
MGDHPKPYSGPTGLDQRPIRSVRDLPTWVVTTFY